ncbi:MAG: dephospho-CoA kinase [Acidimicrobiia bacterium]|nr:dephospho-CoA kinase [Acidimicrobiia bacterium]MDX2466757.1 dephospho-CoA kinase [Acidimicrobiia bacterium]
MRLDGNKQPPLRVIVSGGIGSGKTAVLRILERQGAVVIEADRIGHEVLEPGGAAHDAVAALWPSAMVDGRVDRALLAAIVFTDGEQLALLESITHPAIRDEIAARVVAAGEHDVVLELPFRSELAGPGWARLIVDAPTELRIRRSVARGMAEADAANRLAVQPQREEWLVGAEHVIVNTGTLADLEQAVRNVWRELKAGAGSG